MSELDEAARKLGPGRAAAGDGRVEKRVGEGKPAGKGGSASLSDTTASVAARLEESDPPYRPAAGGVMPQVSITINGRAYPVACDEGEEERIRAVGADGIDSKVAWLRAPSGAGGARPASWYWRRWCSPMSLPRPTKPRAGSAPRRSPPATQRSPRASIVSVQRIEAVAARPRNVPHMRPRGWGCAVR